MNGAFAFQLVANETIEDKIIRAAEVLVSSGISIRGGKISTGGNCVMANNAAKAVCDEMKTVRSKNAAVNFAASIISQWNRWVDENEIARSRVGENHKQEQQARLDTIATMAVELKNLGYMQKETPTNWDRNAANAKLVGYKQPEGVAARFVDAFGMETQPSAKKNTLKVV